MPEASVTERRDRAPAFAGGSAYGERRKPPEQAMAPVISCPSCPRNMRLVGRETALNAQSELLTFQCDCGQVIARMTQ